MSLIFPAEKPKLDSRALTIARLLVELATQNKWSLPGRYINMDLEQTTSTDSSAYRYITQVGLCRLDLNEDSLSQLARSSRIPDEYVVYYHILVKETIGFKHPHFGKKFNGKEVPSFGSRVSNCSL